MAVILCALATPAHSYVLSDDRWPGASNAFYVSIFNAYDGYTSPSGTTWDDAFVEAAGWWNTSTPFTFSTTAGSYSDPCDSLDTRNGVDFTFDVCGTAYGLTTLAVTLSYFIGPVTLETDIVFNGNATVFWNVYSGPYSIFYDEFRRVAAHELGHSLRLGHAIPIASLMYPIAGDVETPQADDIAGTNALYGGCVVVLGIAPDAVVAGDLAVTDCFLLEIGGSDYSLFDPFEVSLIGDGDLTITLNSAEFDTFLWLFDSTPALIATDDDGGTGTNSLISMSLAAGTYTILANSYSEGATGAYTLTTQFVPEPGGTLMLMSGLPLLAWMGHRRSERSGSACSESLGCKRGADEGPGASGGTAIPWRIHAPPSLS
jgi:hypothetical protein